MSIRGILLKVWRRRRLQQDLDAELSFHRELADENHNPVQLGNVTRIREEALDLWRFSLIEDTWRDLKYSIRSLCRMPAFSLIAILTLALGIGANTAIFSVIEAVLLRPLPYSEPGQLFSIETFIHGLRGYSTLPGRIQDYLAWRKAATGFSAIVAVVPIAWNATGSEEPERISGARVSPNFFETLGVQMAQGRAFAADEEHPGKDKVVVISDGLWRRRYGADSGTVGRSIVLNGESHLIVGIAPSSLLVPSGRELHGILNFGPAVDIWKPLSWTNNELQGENWNMGLLGRLKPGQDPERARQQLQAIQIETNDAAFPGTPHGYQPTLTPIREIYSRNVRQRLFIIFGASAMLLLIACTNIANLLLARLVHRSKEFAIRVSLGAARSRLVIQMLAEAFVLALAGGLAGVLLAHYGAHALIAFAPGDLPLLNQIRLNLPVLLFAILASAATGIACGLLPAWRAGRGDIDGALKEGGRVSSAIHTHRLRAALVTLQIAFGTVLLAAAGLLLHSFVKVMNTDRGYEVERVLTAELVLVGQQYRPPGQRSGFYQRLVERIETLPGVLAAGAISDLPVNRDPAGSNRINYATDTNEMAQQGLLLSRPVAGIFVTTPGYFAAIRSVLRAGRLFTETDQTPVAVISENLARQLWPADDLSMIVGRQVRRGDTDSPLITIVGIVDKVEAGALDRDLLPQMYLAHHQTPTGRMNLVVRTSLAPETLASPIRAAVRQAEPNLPVSTMKTMKQIVSIAVGQRRFQLELTVLFGLVALLLAAVGIYGVVSYVVASRAKDISLRIALGAGTRSVLGWAFLTGMRPVLIGLFCGLAGALMINRVIESALYGVAVIDPISLSAVVSVLLVTSALACYVPARRASRVDPTIALRAG